MYATAACKYGDHLISFCANNYLRFNKIVSILKDAEAVRRSKGGPKPSLSVEDMLLATIEYWREYRTYAHIAVGFELSESQIFRIVNITGFAYRFWSIATPKLNRFAKSGTDTLKAVSDIRDKKLITAAFRAIPGVRYDGLYCCGLTSNILFAVRRRNKCFSFALASHRNQCDTV